MNKSDLASSYKALAALCVGLFLTLIDQSMVAVALPAIAAELDASTNQIVWVVAIYLLTFAVPLLITGRLGDRFGQRRMYMIGMAIFVIAAGLCAFAPSIEVLILLRAIQGFGGSLLNPQPMAVINRIFPREHRGTAMGYWSAVGGSAGMFGPVIGGLVVAAGGWRWVFAIYIPVGIISLIAVAIYVPQLERTTSAVDIPSALLSLIAVAGVTVAFQQGPEWEWGWAVWAALAVGIFGFYALYRRQKSRGDDALIPLKLFSVHNFKYGIIAVFTLGFAVYTVQLPVMQYLQVELGMGSAAAGLVLIPMGVMSVLVAPLAGRLTDRIAPGTVSTIGFGTMILSLLLFGIFMISGASMWWLLIPVTLLGIANGLAWSPNSAIALRDLPADAMGAGSGVYNTSRQVGAVIGSASMGAVMQVGVAYGVGFGMGIAMFVPVAVLLVGLGAVRQFRA
ncbi:DHA2 family efflux MFS transporter permease subunit [Corynebacterium lubricantis]|uniref:DHA2 family efflux MFS transporter permease subunit n=1 Tax=Corynebacterium lubricantis TaxID=541095 RepID=UPI0003A9433C|nr:DHA2 family efflux MFS transporter permease subunit [Corynebacterium lubricantis]